MFATGQNVFWNGSYCCAAATVRRPENMAMSGSGLCEAFLPVRQGLHYIFLTFWVLLACPDSSDDYRSRGSSQKYHKKAIMFQWDHNLLQRMTARSHSPTSAAKARVLPFKTRLCSCNLYL